MVINTADLRKYIGINTDFDFNVLKTHLEWAEETYIQDLIGIDLYNKINENLLNGYSAQDEYLIPFFATLTEKINRVISNIAMFDWLSIAGVSISDIGLHRIEGEMGGSTRKSAYQYQEVSAREFYRKRGFNSMDALLKYIMQYIAHFPEFETSISYKELSSDFITSASVFNKHYPIGDSMLLFMKLKPFIKEAEIFDLTPVVGSAFVVQAKFCMIYPTGSYQEVAFPLIRSALAYLAISRGIELCSINLIEDGARLVVKDSTNGNFEKTSKPDLKKIIKDTRTTGENYLGMLCEYLRANITTYPSFVDSRIAPIDNTGRKIVSFY